MQDKHDNRTLPLPLPLPDTHDKPQTWEDAMDQLADERKALLEMLKEVLGTGWDFDVVVRAQTLIARLDAEDKARQAEFEQGKGG